MENEPTEAGASGSFAPLGRVMVVLSCGFLRAAAPSNRKYTCQEEGSA
ncbi:hypothetical protein Hsw_4198 [Hymenobacter swuensis DY53]|uniref:Uncharacterized protein n=1 Tax=Hymenobacter swuensis DY53 TaxID=1227739 RepID=W8F493_9BACT|nr:hypothetical protein Hsw_4198 [Hymenobacter swuensis DY53]